MRQNVIDYFNNEAESVDIQDHYKWFMWSGLTVSKVVASIIQHDNLALSDADAVVRAVRDYIDEMDDNY